MLIGVPKEIKNHEYRVAMTPASARELIAAGQRVMIEQSAGNGAGYSNSDYLAVGAEIAESADVVFDEAELILKVKEPQQQECERLRAGQLLFTYLHLAADSRQAKVLLESGASCIAYETIQGAGGSLPLLAPMSEVAGRMSVQAGAYHLQKAQGGNGTLLPGVPGVPAGRVVIIGGGVVGSNAARVALGLGADVTVLDRSLERLRMLEDAFAGQLNTVYSTEEAIESAVLSADLVVGAVLIPGAAAPKLVSRNLVERMAPGTVLVDVAIDQGGCFETSRPTTHDAPTFTVNGVVHYCVANMPGAVAKTATQALTHATLPYVVNLANHGLTAFISSPDTAAGLNVHRGQITHPQVAQALGYAYVAPEVAVSASGKTALLWARSTDYSENLTQTSC